MFAQVFDKNRTSLVAKGGHVEEEKRPGGGVIRWWKRHRSRQAGWLAESTSTGLLSCLVLRFMLAILITRLVSKA